MKTAAWIVAVFLIAAAPRVEAVSLSVAQEKSASIDKSDQTQSERKALIGKLIKQGIFQKVVKPGSIPRVWVRPAFYALDFDDKQMFIEVVYAYHFDGTDITDFVRIIDSLSGKQVGDYSLVNPGLRMK